MIICQNAQGQTQEPPLLLHVLKNYNARCLKIENTKRLLTAKDNRGGEACDVFVVLGVHIGINGVLALMSNVVSYCPPPYHPTQTDSHLQVGSPSEGQQT